MNDRSKQMPNKITKHYDVRMKGFIKRTPVEKVFEWLSEQSITLSEESILIRDAVGRILTADIISHYNIPSFCRSMMDGYAIVASDSQGASSYNQLQLEIISQSMPGIGTNINVNSGLAIKIMTGAPIPKGANAVLPAENVEAEGAFIYVTESVAEGRNIGKIGEDVTVGSTVLKAHRCLRPQDIALLVSIGIKNVSVFAKPKISILVTGNEILAAGEAPKDFSIVNSNGLMLEALCQRDGGNVISSCIAPDKPENIRQVMQKDYDILLITGGSSVGEEDISPLLLAEEGELAIHGVAMRPSRSTGMGAIGQKKVFLLPGNPVACLCAYDFFAGRFIRQCSGKNNPSPYASATKKLKQKIVSMIGRTDYARVRFNVDDDRYIEPIAISGAGILSSTTQADGFVIIPADKEGYAPETDVTVFLFDS
ncbi:MAG: molybdopterin molybdotransferase MoeA [Methylococcales bacterium]|nr:molybdopterin molybdotransferase MoeA [Methylococcales bacterium]